MSWLRGCLLIGHSCDQETALQVLSLHFQTRFDGLWLQQRAMLALSLPHHRGNIAS